MMGCCTKVVPEIDAYRYSTLAALAAAKDRAVYGYTPEEATILKKLYADLASIQDEVGDDTPLVITMSTQVAALFDMNTLDVHQDGVHLVVQHPQVVILAVVHSPGPLLLIGLRVEDAHLVRAGHGDGGAAGADGLPRWPPCSI